MMSMKSLYIPYLLLSVFVFSLFLVSCGSSQNKLNTSQKQMVEQYVFTDWQGNEIAVSDYAGSVVVIDIWETWCGPCLAAFPIFQEVIDEHPDDIVVIAATGGWRNNREDALGFKAQNDYSFIYVDGSELAQELGITNIPFKIIIGRDGKISKVQTGFSDRNSEYNSLVSEIRS